MDHNNQLFWNSSNHSSISQPGVGPSQYSMSFNASRMANPSFPTPNPASFSLTWVSGNSNGHGNAIGSSSSTYAMHDPQQISSLDLSHQKVLVGYFVTNMVRVGNCIGETSTMIRLVRWKTSGHERQVIIRGVTINEIQVGYIDGFVADFLVPLIDSGLISIQGTTILLPERYIPCEVHVFTKMEMKDNAISYIRSHGVDFISTYPQQFQSSAIDEFLGMTANEVSALMEAEFSIERVHHELVEAPRNVVSTALLPHQKEGLRWLFMRENTTDLPPLWEQIGEIFVNMLTMAQTYSRPEPFWGGVFADDMGTGKTLTLLALIATDKYGWPDCFYVDSPVNDEPRRQPLGDLTIGGASRTTLIVCPASVLSVWTKQLELHLNPGSLSVYLYHGTRTRNAAELKNYDIVLTTYRIVSNEMYCPESPLKAVNWWRLILDEAHNIKNWSSLRNQAVRELDAPRRWVVTGTPMQNETTDIFAITAFLRIEPLDMGNWWTKCITSGVSRARHGIYQLQVLMENISLRRMKDQCLTGLPTKTMETYYVFLTETEREFYNLMEEEAKNFVRIFYTNGDYLGTNVLTLLLRLRQSCLDISLCPSNSLYDLPSLPDVSANPELVNKMRQMMAESEEECPICLVSPSRMTVTVCAHKFCQPCISKALRHSNKNCPICRHPLKPSDLFSVESQESSSPGSSNSTISSKAMALLQLLTASREEDPTVKSVVFSQFKKFLIILEGTLKEAGLKVVRIDGSIPTSKRGKLIEEFGKPDGPMILLACMNVSCEGVDLTAASRVYLMEPWWNPAVEEQAMSRVHRIGQTREVKMIRMIALDTIEERILNLQEEKKLRAQSAFGRRETEGEITSSDVSRLIII